MVEWWYKLSFVCNNCVSRFYKISVNTCNHVLWLALIPHRGSRQQTYSHHKKKKKEALLPEVAQTHNKHTHMNLRFPQTTTNTYPRTNPMSVCSVFSCLHSPVMTGPLDMRRRSHIKGIIMLHHPNGLMPVMRIVRLGFPSSTCWCLDSLMPTAVVSPWLKVNPAILDLSGSQHGDRDSLRINLKCLKMIN